MPLVNAKEMLTKAKAGHYAVGQFNINNLEWTKSILLTAQELNSPVILGVSEGAGKYMCGYKTVVGMVKGMLEELNITVPVALHLDHGSYEGAKACIKAGFSSIMFDGSHYPIEENIAKTKELVAACNILGLSLEAEVGSIGGEEDGVIGMGECADPKECKMVADLGVTMLAAGIGNIHGKYPANWKGLSFETLDAIQQLTGDMPLVLHGGTGIPADMIKKAISLGVSKINVNTECQLAFADATRKYVEAGKDLEGKGFDPRKLLAPGAEAIKATVKPAKTKVTYTTSDEKIATVDAKGVVTGVAAGDVTITVKAGKTTKTVNMTVKKAILKSADQTEYNKIEAVIVGDTKDMKAGDIKVTNTATKATVAVKSVSAKKGAENTYVIETFTGMTDAKEYSVEYAGAIATFTATDGTVANVALTKTEVPAGIKTEVKAVTKDAKGVTLGYFDLTNANSAKGQVTTALTITKGYVQGTDVYLPAVGDTMVAKLTYHTGSFAADGKETGVIENTATITAVDPSTVTYNYAVTIGDSTPKWTATSFKAVTSIKVGTSKKAYFRITDENGKEISSYEGYSVETADSTKLVIDAQNLTKLTAAEGTKGLDIKGVAAGDTYILVKKDGKVAFSIPVSVQGKATATSIDLNKTSVTVMSGAAGTVSEK